MYNRYQGNTGRFVRVPDVQPREIRPRPTVSPALSAQAVPRAEKNPPPSAGGGLGSILPLGKIQEAVGSLVPRILEDIETEDLLLALVLYLMYKESGDRELLIILGAMFLL